MNTTLLKGYGDNEANEANASFVKQNERLLHLLKQNEAN